MIPLTASSEEFVLDLSKSDDIALILDYTVSVYDFTISGEDYAPIKEFCNVVLKSNALYAMSEIISSTWSNICSVEQLLTYP